MLEDEKKRETQVIVNISRDFMRASVSFGLRGGSIVPPTRDEILHALANAGVRYGIRDEDLNMAQHAKPGQGVTVAYGKEPEDGKDASLVYHFDSSKSRPLILENGSVDYKELELVKNVSVNQVLAEKIPATPGVAGVDVLGRPVAPKKGKDLHLPKGPGTFITPDGLKLLSELDGHVFFKNGKVTVSDTCLIMGSVDVGTGNVYAVGNVLIKGNVIDGYTVKAGGNIEILGIVEGAFLFSENGDVKIHQGVHGRNKCIIKCGGNFFSPFVEGVKDLEAKGNILVEKHIMHSKLSCHNHIRVYGHPGLLVGGEVKVILSFEAGELGSENYTKTLIYMGDFTAIPILEKIDQLKTEIYNMELEIAPARRAVKELMELVGRKDAIALGRVKELSPLAEKFKALYPDLKAKRDERTALQESLRVIEEEQYIQVEGTTYPGVILRAHENDLVIRNSIQGRRWRLTPRGWKAMNAYRESKKKKSDSPPRPPEKRP